MSDVRLSWEMWLWGFSVDQLTDSLNWATSWFVKLGWRYNEQLSDSFTRSSASQQEVKVSVKLKREGASSFSTSKSISVTLTVLPQLLGLHKIEILQQNSRHQNTSISIKLSDVPKRFWHSSGAFSDIFIQRYMDKVKHFFHIFFSDGMYGVMWPVHSERK